MQGVAISFKAGHGMIHYYPFLALMFDEAQKQWTKSVSLSESSFLIK
ncbi:MAG: hypothetical protein HXX18_14540 [Bacteroidetes bacterium]|nr:hypothetical protein [Bacteroidota bacterium]